MFSLQKLVSKDYIFFDLLDASAVEAQNSLVALSRILSNTTVAPSLSEFHASKEADKKLTERINEALVDAFVTEIEREDIEVISSALYKIPKTVEKFAERFIISESMVKGVNFSTHIDLLKVATNQVVEMVKILRTKPSVEEVKKMNNVLQKVEGEADELILKMVADLYSGKHDPLKALALKDLYELLEKVIDRCRDAGNAVTQVIIKSA